MNEWTEELKSLMQARYNKIMNIGSEWPSEQVSCKLYIRGPNSNAQAGSWPPLYKALVVQESRCKYRGLTDIQMKPEIHLDYAVSVNFPHKWKIQ